MCRNDNNFCLCVVVPVSGNDLTPRLAHKYQGTTSEGMWCATLHPVPLCPEKGSEDHRDISGQLLLFKHPPEGFLLRLQPFLQPQKDQIWRNHLSRPAKWPEGVRRAGWILFIYTRNIPLYNITVSRYTKNYGVNIHRIERLIPV